MSQLFNIQSVRHFAQINDAAIMIDNDGDIAAQRRHYTKDGMIVVRHAPDRGEFYPLSVWEKAWQDERAMDLLS